VGDGFLSLINFNTVTRPMQTRWVAPKDLFRDDPPEGPGVCRGGFRTTLLGSVEDRETAAPHLRTLAFMDDTEEALRGYRRAVELDPANANGWNELGHLYHRTGQLDYRRPAHRPTPRAGRTAKDA
jgi:hypothetical protein